MGTRSPPTPARAPAEPLVVATGSAASTLLRKIPATKRAMMATSKPATATCSEACAAERCGNGRLDAGEACDDGNDVDTDGCTSACVVARCGDGIRFLGVEACDDGNRVDEDACLNSCADARCGDGVVRDGFELCDDGNLDAGDGCDGRCQLERLW